MTNTQGGAIYSLGESVDFSWDDVGVALCLPEGSCLLCTCAVILQHENWPTHD